MKKILRLPAVVLAVFATKAILISPCAFAAPERLQNSESNPEGVGGSTSSSATPVATPGQSNPTPSGLDGSCIESLTKLGPEIPAKHGFFCEKALDFKGCKSNEGRPIRYLDFKSASKKSLSEKRILVFALIHGDEPLAAQLALEWAKRLQEIDARNSWRIVPILNPDGLVRMTRMNANGVDLNRNFPTKDWQKEAHGFWAHSSRKDPRRFPGSQAGSEPETQCAMAMIEDFKPDFIVSIHTPYAVLDFDGPQMAFPKYKDLPWRALGNFPGSLGRYMWKDNGLPVLTIELKDKMVDAGALQDVIGQMAINAGAKTKKKNAMAQLTSD